jgi:integrase/recombinase XerD
MRDPALVEVLGPLAPYASRFNARLEQLGYARGSRVAHLRLVARLSAWLEERGDDCPVLSEAMLAMFVSEQPSSPRRPGRSARSFTVLISVLRELGAVPVKSVAPPVGPVDILLADYVVYLAGERGLAVTTIKRNVGLVRPFLSGRVSDGRIDLASLTAADVTAFMLTCASSTSSAMVQNTGTALRSLLRYLYLQGMVPSLLAGAVPSASSWKLSGLPRYLTPGEVSQMVASCDPTTAVGSRNIAILLLLSRLGLRAGEVAALRLDDIDWRAGEVILCGKGNRRDRLPLPCDVGDALVCYLRVARPQEVAGREVFVTVRAPRQGLTRGAVTQIVARSAQRAGLGVVYAHRLRHTAATSMLHAGGSLDEIGQVLRHQRLLTTAIYAKVDRDGLRPLARPWPAGAER